MDTKSTPSSTAGKNTIRRTRGVVPVLLVAVSFLAACWFYQRWNVDDFNVPLNYQVDSLAMMANSLCFNEGASYWRMEAQRLNAPFTAIMDDAPLIEKIMYILYGQILNYLPRGAAANCVAWLAIITSVLGFYFAARWCEAPRLPSATTSILFGFSHYLLFRTSGHLTLAYAFHIPLMLALIFRLFSMRSLRGRDWLAGLFIALISANLNPYYGFFFAFLMGLSFLIFLVKRNSTRSCFTLIMCAIWACSFYINLHSYRSIKHDFGENAAAIVRTIRDIEQWSLRLTDLIWPVGHPIEAWNRLAASNYFGGGIAVDEHASNFLGLIGLIAVAILIIHTARKLIDGRTQEISSEAWCAMLALAYGIQGGINMIFGSFGFYFLRATNRYSLILLCAALLFLARDQLPKLKKSHLLFVCTFMLSVHFWELSASPRRMIGEAMENNRALMAIDRDFGDRLQSALPPKAMVFQLPVWDYPESHPRNLMTDYAHFSPFIWTKDLRFSYGTCKGRVREAWQHEVERLPVAEMIQQLETYGFSALYINRLAYTAEELSELETNLVSAGLPLILESENKAFAVYRLNPSEQPALPFAEPALSYGKGFYYPGPGTGLPWHRYTSGNAELLLQRGDAGATLIEVGVNLLSERKQTITISTGNNVWWRETLDSGESSLARFVMEPTSPVSKIHLATDTMPDKLPSSRGHMVGFAVELTICRRITNSVATGNGFHKWDSLPDGQRLAWAWKSSGAEIVLPVTTNQLGRELCLSIVSPTTLNLEMKLNDRSLWSGRIEGASLTPICVGIPAGSDRKLVTIETDMKPWRGPTNDPRLLTFAVSDLKIMPVK